MPMQSPSLDSLLDAYLGAPSGDAERCLEALLMQAENVYRPILREKLRLSTARAGSPESLAGEDVRGEIVLNLISRLRRTREATDADPIADLRAFIAVTAYRACSAQLRRKYPQRASLRNKLYSLLTRSTFQHGLSLWECEGRKVCGFEEWKQQSRMAVRTPRCQRLLHSTKEFVREALKHEGARQMSPPRLLARIFDWVGAPMELDDLVAIVAELWEVRDQPEVTPAFDDEGRVDPFERLAQAGPDVSIQVDQKNTLRQLWAEIRQLPPRQVAALLLNLRDADGRGVVAFLPLLEIASRAEIAGAMQIAFERFDALWSDLPLEDLLIAGLLGCTRQQVINLRKVARERLARRMKALETAA